MCVCRSEIDDEHGGNLKEATFFQLTGWLVRRLLLRRTVAGEKAPPHCWAGLTYTYESFFTCRYKYSFKIKSYQQASSSFHFFWNIPFRKMLKRKKNKKKGLGNDRVLTETLINRCSVKYFLSQYHYSYHLDPESITLQDWVLMTISFFLCHMSW